MEVSRISIPQLALLLLLLVTASTCVMDTCPVWFFYNTTSNTCECGDKLAGVVTCESGATPAVSLLYCYCMTHNEGTQETLVGACTAMCTRRSTPDCQSFNAILTNDTQELNDEMCGELNRTGQLCGRCKDNHSPEVYSYSLNCVECYREDFAINLLKYTAIAFLPLTVFYIFVIALKISITSGSMVAYILTCQLISTPILIRILKPDNYQNGSTLFLISCFSMWNLDFFRSVYPPFCLHPTMNTMHVLALDYLVGVYPLFLILFTYLTIVIHDRCPTAAKISSFSNRIFQNEWNIRGSLIQTFASFLILSYVKILNVSFDLLFPVSLQTVHGKRIDKLYLYNDAEIVYFGKEHLPFGILAIFMLTVFNLLPLALLLLYPCRCFHKSLNCCGVHNHILFTFMDAFQGCYRHRPRDYRYFAALYLFIRILQLLTFALVRDFIFIPIMGFYFLVLTAALVFIEPYIETVHNKSDKVFFLWYSSVYFLMALNVYLRPSEPQIPMAQIHSTSMTLLAVLPITFGTVMVFKRVIPQKISSMAKSVYARINLHRNQQEDRGSKDNHGPNENTPLIEKN